LAFMVVNWETSAGKTRLQQKISRCWLWRKKVDRKGIGEYNKERSEVEQLYVMPWASLLD